MEFKVVREVPFEEKSSQEIEQDLLAKHEKEQGIETEENVEKITSQSSENEETIEKATENENEIVQEASQVEEIDDEKVLSHLRKKTGRDDISYDNLIETEKVEIELPEDLEALRRYKAETGRGINDFVKLNRDLNAEPPEALIKEYLLATNPEFDDEDVEYEMRRSFSYDEDFDNDDDKKAKEIQKKKTLAKAKAYLTEQKEKYKAPLESSTSFIPETEKEAYARFKESLSNQEQDKENLIRKQEHFSKKTNELFSDNFEGFEYGSGDNKTVLKIGNVDTVKSAQSNAMNFMSKHLDENGMLKNAMEYHKALNAAMDPDALWNAAYEKGIADAITKSTKEGKNIDMSPASATREQGKKPMVREVNPDNGSRLTIRTKTK